MCVGGTEQQERARFSGLACEGPEVPQWTCSTLHLECSAEWLAPVGRREQLAQPPTHEKS